MTNDTKAPMPHISWLNLTQLSFQCTHLGFGVEDLHRIAMSSLITEERYACLLDTVLV